MPSKLNSFWFTNIKAFDNTQDLELRPITIILWKNSSGKSTVIQMLNILKQTLEWKWNSKTLLLNWDLFSVGFEKNFIKNKDIKKDIKIKLNLSLNNKRIFKMYALSSYYKNKYSEEDLENIKIEMVFNINKNAKILLKKYFIIIKEDIYEFRIIWSTIGSFYVNWEDKTQDIKKTTLWLTNFEIKKFLVWPTLARISMEEELKSFMVILTNEIYRSIDSIFQKYYYIWPLRAFPSRFYLLDWNNTDYVGKDWKGIIGLLSNNFKANEYTDFKKYMKDLWLVSNIDFKRKIENGYSFNLNDLDLSLLDIWFWASQILPVIAQILFSSRWSIITIEQPEIHLHPNSQLEFASIVNKMLKKVNYDKQIIFETHSEHVITRFRRLVKEKELSSNNIIIYFVDKWEIKKVRIDNNWNLSEEWPDGFFSNNILDDLFYLNS